MNRFALAGAAAALLMAGPAFSQQWYAGVSLGSTRGEIDEGRINNDLTTNLGFFTASTSGDDSDSGGRVFLGRNVLPWLDIEGYYADFGKTKWDSTVSPPGTLSASIRTKAFGIAALGSISPMPALKLFGKLGIASTESKASFSSSGFVELARSEVKERQTSAVYGAGAQYEFAPTFAARLEYDVHDRAGSDEMGGKFKVKTVSLGVLMRF